MDTVGYTMKWIHLVAMAIVLVGALNWGAVGLTGRNPVGWLLGRWAWIVYVIVGMSALALMFRRATYLPFLGETVLPCSLMPERIPANADTEVTVNGLQPGAKVLFWAAEPATEGLARINSWQKAYLDFANAGVTTVDSMGRATFRVRSPQSYTVPMKGELASHVHWRVCGDGGLVGPVQTTPIGGVAL